MDEPMLELKTTGQKLARLEMTKLRAATRTKRRIAQRIEEEKIQELEARAQRGEKVESEIDELISVKSPKSATKK